jgi:hypothetical protein
MFYYSNHLGYLWQGYVSINNISAIDLGWSGYGQVLELGGKKIFQHKITCSGIVLTSGWLAVCLL